MTECTGPCFFCRQLPEVGGVAVLEEDEARHVSGARRLRSGDRLGLIDGRGTLATGTLHSTAPDVQVRIVSRETLSPPYPQLTLAAGITKGDRFAQLIDMATQLGVTRVVPLSCERSIGVAGDNALSRWRRIAREACKQSRNPHLPEVVSPMPVPVFASSNRGGALALFGDPDGSDLTDLAPVNGCISLAVGPEGGFTDTELEVLLSEGYRGVKLGRYVLRVEAAAVSAVALLMSGVLS